MISVNRNVAATSSAALKSGGGSAYVIYPSVSDKMVRWARPLVALLALLAILAGGIGGAWAGKPIHMCDGMDAEFGLDVSMSISGDGKNDGTLPGCPALACPSTQIFPPPQSNFAVPIVLQLVSSSLPHDDLERSGLCGPPDLRPPI
jgi:hypothetical protein